MTEFQTDERGKLRRHWVDQAITLAMQNRWEDAVRVNRTILELFPNDVDAFNRLGRSLTELGRYRDAREAYQKAVDFDPTNTIARKNLTRLSALNVEVAAPVAERVDPRMFTAETGKTGVVSMVRPAGREVLARLTAGDQVTLQIDGRTLTVTASRGEYLGQIDPRMSQRLIDLIKAGNRYAAAVMAMEDGNLRVIIRETYQDPANIGRVSFPVRGDTVGIRPYTRDSLLKYELEEEEDGEDGDGGDMDSDDSDDAAEPAEFEEDRGNELEP